VTSRLFSPIALRGLTLPNRIVVSPMCQYSAVDGTVGDWHIMHLGQFAVGGAGLVMVEASGVANLAERYLEMILQETEYAVPTGGLKAQAMAYGGLRRGVARDEAWRSMVQFKMFGLSVAMLQ